MDRPALGTLLRNNLLGAAFVFLALVLIGTSAVIDASNGDSDAAATSSAQDAKGKNHPKGLDFPKDKMRLDKDDKLKRGDKGHGLGFDQQLPPGLIQQFMGQLPKELRQDLRQLRRADPDDQAAQAHTMFQKALAGDYGDEVKEMAEMLEELVNGK